MKNKNLLFILPCLFFSATALSEVKQSRYNRKPAPAQTEKNLKEEPASEGIAESSPAQDAHVKIIGWDSVVPLKHILNSIQEGTTTQIAVLKLFSSPNIITRSFEEKEEWIYHWTWSYEHENDPSKTLIYMDHPGQRLKKNKKPVSLSIVFDDKNIVESYRIHFLKVKKDEFGE